MDRRRFLALGSAAGIGLLAGCPGRSESPSPPTTSTDERTTTPREHRDTIFVSTDGSDTSSGTEDAPLRTIQEGINRAQPGQTIRCSEGDYRENLRTKRSGTPDNPITITGPSSAVVVGEGNELQLHIRHDHIHVTGLTFNGLQNEDAPDQTDSYAGQNIFVEPEIVENETPTYLRGIKIKPHAVGNTLGACTNINLSKDVEVGTFEVIGPAGLRHLLDGDTGWFGEVVYLGSFIGAVDRYEGIEVDRTSGVHIHHINNSTGHPHTNLVDAKVGTHDVRIEYCTDAGGAGEVSGGRTAAIAVRGQNATVRWNKLRRGKAMGINVGSEAVAEPEASATEVPESTREAGQSNSIYQNSIKEFESHPIVFQVSASKQELVCGNEYDGELDTDADRPCPRMVPVSADIGHTGGNSPWN